MQHSHMVWPNPTATSPTEHKASLQVTAPLVDAIIERHGQFNTDTIAQQQQCKVKVRQEKREAHLATTDNLHSWFPPKLQKLMDVAKEKGSSSWLVALPIESHGFTLHKSAFRDAICLRYGCQPPLFPTTCACGKSFTIDHALNCPTGGFPIIRHNEVRDLTADLMSEVCHGVCVCGTCPPTAHRRTIITCHSQQRGLSSIRCESVRILGTATAECIL